MSYLQLNLAPIDIREHVKLATYQLRTSSTEEEDWEYVAKAKALGVPLDWFSGPGNPVCHAVKGEGTSPLLYGPANLLIRINRSHVHIGYLSEDIVHLFKKTPPPYYEIPRFDIYIYSSLLLFNWVSNTELALPALLDGSFDIHNVAGACGTGLLDFNNLGTWYALYQPPTASSPGVRRLTL